MYRIYPISEHDVAKKILTLKLFKQQLGTRNEQHIKKNFLQTNKYSTILNREK